MVTLEQMTSDLVNQFFQFYPELKKYEQKILFIFAGMHTEFSFNDVKEKDLINLINKEYSKGKTKVIFLNLDETIISRSIDTIHKILDKIKISYKDIFYACSGLDAYKGYKSYIKEKYETPINIIVLNKFETNNCELQFPLEHIEYVIENKPKLFLCLNRIPRAHRLILFSKIVKNNLLDKSYCSFLYDSNAENENIKWYFKDEEDYKWYVAKKNKIPIILNTPPEINGCKIEHDDLFYYRNSYFSLVTETLFFNALDNRDSFTRIESRFISEKTFKPIILKHPFILISKYKSLEFLKSIGYKTFSNVFDETYDTIYDDDLRLEAVEKEIIRLSKIKNKDWLLMQKEIKPIVDHNYKLYHDRISRGFDKFRITDKIEKLFAN
jgi:hypothetical protein